MKNGYTFTVSVEAESLDDARRRVIEMLIKTEYEGLYSVEIGGNNFLLINLFDRSVEKKTTIESAVFDCVGMVGMVVIDRADRRIYDGECQRWYSLEEYLAAFPPVQWLSDFFFQPTDGLNPEDPFCTHDAAKR